MSTNVERSRFIDVSAAELRAAIRQGLLTGPTTGLARGYAQANLVILPQAYAAEFAAFCRLNPRPCPLIAETQMGNPEPADVAPGADLRTDVPSYRVFRRGVADHVEPHEIAQLWQEDFVAFLLGCSFTFEHALLTAGLRIRHIDQGVNVPMYRTSIDCQPSGRFAGPLVVSMRPFEKSQIDRVVEITSHYPTMHGAPIHIGDPQALGIQDIGTPDFGDAVEVRAGEMPVFWACGVTPQLALAQARPEIAVTHSPGCMFVTDRTDESFASNPISARARTS